MGLVEVATAFGRSAEAGDLDCLDGEVIVYVGVDRKVSYTNVKGCNKANP